MLHIAPIILSGIGDECQMIAAREFATLPANAGFAADFPCFYIYCKGLIGTPRRRSSRVITGSLLAAIPSGLPATRPAPTSTVLRASPVTRLVDRKSTRLNSSH